MQASSCLAVAASAQILALISLEKPPRLSQPRNGRNDRHAERSLRLRHAADVNSHKNVSVAAPDEERRPRGAACGIAFVKEDGAIGPHPNERARVMARQDVRLVLVVTGFDQNRTGRTLRR
jgi:hypothetical protein